MEAFLAHVAQEVEVEAVLAHVAQEVEAFLAQDWQLEAFLAQVAQEVEATSEPAIDLAKEEGLICYDSFFIAFRVLEQTFLLCLLIR